MTDLEAQIKEVANVVEHRIQLQLTELVTTNDEMQIEKIHERLSHSLKQVAEEFDRVQKESLEFQDKGKQAPKESLVQDSSPKGHTPNVENNMVGRDNQRNRMLAELTGYGGSPRELRVIPIVGMGGIGKTTLAKEVYNDASVRLHFDVHSWATVSQQHNAREILLSLLCSTKGETFNSLKGKRYLIVLDDMWKSEAWDGIRLWFPCENNGSRILLTTRNTEVACYAGTGGHSLQIGLMGPDESWNLFGSIAFSNEALAYEFETIGKQIVEKCHGLPLTIVLVAGLLKSKRTIEYWENIAKNVKSITNDPDKQCLNVLGLSYNDLTSDLKACLLYFGIFPEDSEISVKRLARFWMAEGFLKFVEDLDEEAEKCLQELVDRCLVLISRKSRDKKIRSCKYWRATNDNFSVLERLVIRDCPYLDKIPIEFADIDSLQLIKLSYCSVELEASAERIQQEQEDLGNKPVDVRIKKSSAYNITSLWKCVCCTFISYKFYIFLYVELQNKKMLKLTILI
ncbi:unnamed protein product [Withania somnifera]